MSFGTFFLPGPTEVRPEILQAMTHPMISHRSGEFRTLFARLQSGLKVVFATERPVFIASCSATGLMEAAVRCGPAGRVLSLVNGAFSERFAHVAETCGREVDRYEVPWGHAHDPREVTARARLGGCGLVTVVHSETSTGALNDVHAISDAAHAASARCAIDSVTGVRGVDLRFDEWGLDYVFTGSQKALALPPGLAFGVVSEAFLASGERANRGVYFDLAEFAANAARSEAPNTPALPLYFALDAQLAFIQKEGMATSFARHAAMAARTADWARGEGLEIVAPEGHRSPTVTAIQLPPDVTSATVVRAVAAVGFTIGSGYGKLKETTIRIGHMGDHTPVTLEPCLRACGNALRAVGQHQV